MKLFKTPISASVKCALCLVGGLVMGSATTFFALKEHYKKESEDKVNALTKAYCDSLDGIYHGGTDPEVEESSSVAYISSNIDDFTEYENKPHDVMVRGDRDSAYNGFDYSAISYKEEDKKPERIEMHPYEENEDENEEVGVVLDLNRQRKIKTKKPRIIRQDEYGMIPGYAEAELFFYKGDGVLTGNEDADIVDSPEYLIGNALTKYGFFENDERTIYVRNDSISTDFIITKIDGSWAAGGDA